MSEIKFRAWDRNLNEIVYGRSEMSIDFTKDGKHQYAIAPTLVIFNAKPLPAGYEDDGTPIFEASYVLMQWTGLKDKNGVDIYEDDIVKNKQGIVYPVKWIDGGLIAYRDSGDWSFLAYEGRIDFEVIGNIYENPELLKAEA